jgi:seryl-tRNA synthetase
MEHIPKKIRFDEDGTANSVIVQQEEEQQQITKTIENDQSVAKKEKKENKKQALKKKLRTKRLLEADSDNLKIEVNNENCEKEVEKDGNENIKEKENIVKEKIEIAQITENDNTKTDGVNDDENIVQEKIEIAQITENDNQKTDGVNDSNILRSKESSLFYLRNFINDKESWKVFYQIFNFSLKRFDKLGYCVMLIMKNKWIIYILSIFSITLLE